MPERGDIVIVTPPGTRTDYIKRVIGLPGDTLRMVDGQLFINGQPVKRQARGARTWSRSTSTRRADRPPIRRSTTSGCSGADGKMYCRVPIVRETLPNGRTYETVELGRSRRGRFRPGDGPRRPRLADGRQSRRLRRQPRARMAGRPRRPGAVGEYRRPRRVHHLLARRLDRWWNPLSWIEALRRGRAGRSLRNS